MCKSTGRKVSEIILEERITTSPTSPATLLSTVKNFGPVTLREFEAMGITTLEQIKALGFEETCRLWIQHFPERLNANAFLGIITAMDDTVWTKATRDQKSEVHLLVTLLRRELGLPARKPIRKSKKYLRVRF